MRYLHQWVSEFKLSEGSPVLMLSRALFRASRDEEQAVSIA